MNDVQGDAAAPSAMKADDLRVLTEFDYRRATPIGFEAQPDHSVWSHIFAISAITHRAVCARTLLQDRCRSHAIAGDVRG